MPGPRATSFQASVRILAAAVVVPTVVWAQSSGHQADGSYALTDGELKLDCKRLTGRMHIRILQIRDTEQRAPTSAASRSMQSTLTPLFGGTRRGADPEADHRRDVAVLEAYNRRLVAKGCKAFDLAAELRIKSSRETPTPKKQP